MGSAETREDVGRHGLEGALLGSLKAPLEVGRAGKRFLERRAEKGRAQEAEKLSEEEAAAELERVELENQRKAEQIRAKQAEEQERARVRAEGFQNFPGQRQSFLTQESRSGRSFLTSPSSGIF